METAAQVAAVVFGVAIGAVLLARIVIFVLRKTQHLDAARRVDKVYRDITNYLIPY